MKMQRISAQNKLLQLKKDLKKQTKEVQTMRTDFIKVTQSWKADFSG